MSFFLSAELSSLSSSERTLNLFLVSTRGVNLGGRLWDAVLFGVCHFLIISSEGGSLPPSVFVFSACSNLITLLRLSTSPLRDVSFCVCVWGGGGEVNFEGGGRKWQI